MLDRIVIELEERVDVVGDYRDGLGKLGAEVGFESFDRRDRMGSILGAIRTKAISLGKVRPLAPPNVRSCPLASAAFCRPITRPIIAATT